MNSDDGTPDEGATDAGGTEAGQVADLVGAGVGLERDLGVGGDPRRVLEGKALVVDEAREDRAAVAELGQPVPDSNLSSELKSGSPDTTST